MLQHFFSYLNLKDGHLMTAECISFPPIPPMNFPWNRIPSPDQLAAMPPQITYSYSTTTTTLPSVQNYGFQWNNTPNSTHHHNPALEGATNIGYSSSPVTGSDYSSPSTSQMAYPDGRYLWSPTSSHYTAANHIPLPSIFDHNVSTSDFSPYNALPYQWQPHTGHGEQIGYPSNQSLVNQSYSFPLHSYPSFPLLSCRWINDDAVTQCEFVGTLEELKSHCKAIHFTGPKIAQKCQWEGCDYYNRNDPTVRVMRRDSAWRHTYEKHLRLKRGSV
ncbi:uncharacterized protein BJ212DRAFT_127178 [Suillus subaureus]|uniref:Uncharacterized protein n=1 Tax=Suillus subaureus TaxID=48587 RepID=A0A9P7EDI1_9AGAM|nr:uncharacterized protein BJ212DRAFT_127178 [Suillus subaureus]KAG1818158.1 hypothetical protein BJ212DRAFT_127178 [Suillus subaureus]